MVTTGPWAFPDHRGAASTVILAAALIFFPRLSWAQSLDEARQLVAEGRSAEAAVAFRAAADSADDPATEATARNNACVLFNGVGDAATALPECVRALALRRDLGDDRRLARTLNNLALVEQSLGRFDEAGTSFEEALVVNRRRGDAAAETLVRSNLGWLWTSAGRYGEAVTQLERALQLASEHAESPWAAEQQAVARLNYGVMLEKLGAYREALELYEKLLAEPAALDAGRRAAVELNRGVMYRNLGDPTEALAAFESAAGAFEALGDGASLSNAWLNIGLARHLNLAQLDAAAQAYDRALEEAERSGDVAEAMQVWLQMGRLRLERGELEAASLAVGRALHLAESSGSSAGRWAALDGRGRVFEAKGSLEAARQDFEQALAIIEGVRRDLDEHHWRVGYFDDKRAVYAAMVRVLANLARDRPGGEEGARAWEWVQRAKARELLDAVGGGAPPLTAGELPPLLAEDALLELFVGEHTLWAWVATADEGPRLHDLGPAGPVIEHTRSLYRALAAGELLPEGILASLSATLLAATDVLGSDPSQLWISADGPLRRLPFEVLEVGGEKLIDRLSVSYLPNASALATVRRSAGEPVEGPMAPLAALGDPRIPGATPTSRGPHALPTPGELLVRRFSLSPLPGSRQELEAIARVWARPSELHLEDTATEATFRRLAAQEGGVLHLATHTLLDDGPGGGAAILLTPEGEDDGLLWARELSRLDVGRRLTVLAACRSGLDPSRGSDALASLSGALLAAGSSAVVASLWDVNDGATAVFMEQLYYQLGRGLAPGEALRQAKLRLRTDPRWDRPELWAAFVLVGDTPPLVPARRPWGLALFVLLALGVGWLLLSKRRGTARS